jgi:hypothetical protein
MPGDTMLGAAVAWPTPRSWGAAALSAMAVTQVRTARAWRLYSDLQPMSGPHGRPARSVMSYYLSQQGRQAGAQASLPVGLGTDQLSRVAPEMAERIAAVWSDVSSTSLMLEALLVGDLVPNSSAAVTGELLRLYEYNARCRLQEAPDTAWELPWCGPAGPRSDAAATTGRPA